jgi:GAF domain-containing protein
MAQAREQGLRSSLSLPLFVKDTSVGALNLYSFDRIHAFDDDARAHFEGFAAQASTALMLALRQAKHQATNQQLEAALVSRTVIDQALGIIMGQQRCTAHEAFDILRAHSQNNNIKLRDVAAQLVAHTSDGRPGEVPGSDPSD